MLNANVKWSMKIVILIDQKVLLVHYWQIRLFANCTLQVQNTDKGLVIISSSMIFCHLAEVQDLNPLR